MTLLLGALRNRILLECIQRRASGENLDVSSSILMPALVGWLACAAVMTLAWARQRRTRNAGIVDVLWTFVIGALGVAAACVADGWIGRRVLVGALVGIWSLRLGAHLWIRVSREPEDGRYAALREELGARFDSWMFGFFQAQALLAALLSLVFLVLGSAELAGWRIVDGVGVALFLSSIVGEGVADRQLARWRSDPANRGKTCRAGLWRYSRHPNYFFEWIHWLVYPVLGIGLPFGPLLWIAPAAMLFLMLKVTGVPPTEKRSLRSRGNDYRAYQQETNAFFPGPPRAVSRNGLELS